MVGVTEYGEDMDVRLGYDKGRPVIVASNEAGYSGTFVDLIQLLEWVNKNMPEFKRGWVGLTDEEFKKVCWESGGDGITGDREEALRAMEAKLKEKNA